MLEISFCRCGLLPFPTFKILMHNNLNKKQEEGKIFKGNTNSHNLWYASVLAGWAPVWFVVDFSVRWHNLNSVASWCAYFTHWDILYRSDNFKRDPVTWGDFLSGNRKCKDHQEWQQQPLWEIHRDQLWQEVPDHRSEHEDVSLREIQSRFSGSISD